MKAVKILLLVLFAVSAQGKRDFRHNDQGTEKCHEVECERKECERPKRWNAEKCACECPQKSKCFPVGAIFDENTCSWCRPKTCEGKKVNDNKCNCVCPNKAEMTPENLKKNYAWDETTCDQYCALTSCEGGQAVDENCECSCPNKAEMTPENLKKNYAWDETTCDQYCALTSCEGGQAVDENCECSCPNKAEMTEENLKKNYAWDETTCDQYCALTSCPGKQTVNANCECSCPNPPSSVDSNKYFDDVACTLHCKEKVPEWGCIYEGQEWSEDLCGCHCPNQETTACDYPSFFSPKQGCKCVYPCDIPPPFDGCENLKTHWCQETCECECKEDLNRTCSSLQHWNNKDCYCECTTTLNCPNNKIFDGHVCECVCEDFSGCDESCYAKNVLWIYDESQCGCACPDEATIKAGCSADGKIYDKPSCGCKCRPGIKCSKGKKPDPDTCKCV